MDKADSIMARMGFPVDARGRYVDELRAHIAKQVDGGLLTRSGGTWAPRAEPLTLEERAREILGMDWEVEHRHGYRVEAMDGLSFRRLPAWVGDRLREAGMRYRIWRDRNLVNPYKKGV